MDLINKIEDVAKGLNLNMSIEVFRNSLKELDFFLDTAYKKYEIQKFTVFLSILLKDIIEKKETEYLSMIISSRRVSVLKPKEKGKYLNRFRVKIINKYSPYLVNSELFKYELNEVLYLNKMFNETINYIDCLNELYVFDEVEKKIVDFRKFVNKITHLQSVDLTNSTIQLYTSLLTKLEDLKRQISFNEVSKKNLISELESISENNIKQIRYELQDLKTVIIDQDVRLHHYKTLVKLLKKINPYLIDQYDRKYLLDLINDDFKVKFKDLNTIEMSVVFKVFTEFNKDYRFTKFQHLYLVDIEKEFYKKGLIEIYENKILWINSKARLNRLCNYLVKNVDEFRYKGYNYLIRSIYKRYNLSDPDRNDLRENKYNSDQYIDEIKEILNHN